MKIVEIDFQRQRDFGDKMNATFIFITQNIAMLLKLLLYFAGPFILIASIFTAYYQKNILSLLAINMSNPFEILNKIFNFDYLMVLIFTILAHLMLMNVTYSYISLYVQRGQSKITIEDVWNETKDNFIRVFTSVILSGIVIIISCIFLLFPGLYVAVAFSILVIIIVHEKIDFFEASSRCFYLIRHHWWETFGLIIVISIVTSFISYIFMIPQLVLTIFVTMGIVQKTLTENTNIAFAVVTAFSTFGRTLLSVIPIIAIAFQYFSLVEEKESPSLLKRIDEINQ